MSEKTNTRKHQIARKALLCVGTALGASLLVFALFGRGVSPASGVPGSSDRDRSSESSNDKTSHMADAPDGNVAESTGAGDIQSTSRPTENGDSSGSNGSGSGSSGGGSSTLPPVDGVTETVDDAVDEIADQLGETVDTVEETLDDAGVDLDEVRNDVVELVEGGLPLDEAVDQVLGLLPLPSPVPSPGGVLGGLLG